MVQLAGTYLQGMDGNLGFPAGIPQHLTEQYLPPGLPLIEVMSVHSQRGDMVNYRLVLPVPTEKLTHERC